MIENELDNIYFSCPDCETGKMHKVKQGSLKNLFRCNSCETTLCASPKLMHFLIFPYFSKTSKEVDPVIPHRLSNAPS